MHSLKTLSRVEKESLVKKVGAVAALTNACGQHKLVDAVPTNNQSTNVLVATIPFHQNC